MKIFLYHRFLIYEFSGVYCSTYPEGHGHVFVLRLPIHPLFMISMSSNKQRRRDSLLVSPETGKLGWDKIFFKESFGETSQDQLRPKLALILVRKKPQNHASTGPKRFKKVQKGRKGSKRVEQGRKGSKLVIIWDYTRLYKTSRDQFSARSQ